MRTEGSPRGARSGSPGPGAKRARGPERGAIGQVGPGDGGAKEESTRRKAFFREGSPRNARPGPPGPGAKLARGTRAWGPWATGPGDWGARTKASPKARSENIRKRALEKGPREAWNQAPPGPGAKMARGTQPGDLGQRAQETGGPRKAHPEAQRHVSEGTCTQKGSPRGAGPCPQALGPSGPGCPNRRR